MPVFHEKKADSKNGQITPDHDFWYRFQFRVGVSVLLLAARERARARPFSNPARRDASSAMVDEHVLTSHLHPSLCPLSFPRPRLLAASL